VAGRNLAAALQTDDSENSENSENSGDSGDSGGPGSGAGKAGQVYAFCGLIGLTAAMLQGLLAQTWIGGPAAMAPPYLTSALAGAIIPATIAIIIGLAAPWLRGQPPWTERVRYPISSVVLAAVGILAIRARTSGLPIDRVPNAVTALLGICGAGLLGVAIAVTLVTDRRARLVMGALLAAACMAIIGPSNLHSTIVIYLVTVVLWWIRRASRITVDNLPQRWRQALASTVHISDNGRRDQ